MSRKVEFLNKLHDLMAEYKVSINFTCGPCSDTHGLYDEAMTIEMIKENPSSPWDEEEIFRVDGWGFTEKDLDYWQE